MSQKAFTESKNAAFLAQMKARREQGVSSGEPKEFSTAPGITAERQEREWLQEQLTLARKSEIQLELLHEVPGRRRMLTEAQFLELKNNLSQNQLVSAITVRKRENSGFEIVSGHNRVAAYRELGYTTIKAIIIDGDEHQSDLNAFYANLIQPSLPDFEKFLGFKKIQETTGKTQKEMALEAGVAPPLVNLWFSFSDIPDEAIEIIKNHPEKIGATAASAFAKLAKAGKNEQVIEAIKLLCDGKLTQSAATKLASQNTTKKEPKDIHSKKILSGRHIFAEMRGVNLGLTIRFTSEEVRKKAEPLIEEVMRNLAKEKTPG